MNLTEEQKEQGRRNFLKALAGTPALAALGAAATAWGPIKGGPVKAAVIGTGGMGGRHVRNLTNEVASAQVVALADVDQTRMSEVAAACGATHTFIEYIL